MIVNDDVLSLRFPNPKGLYARLEGDNIRGDIFRLTPSEVLCFKGGPDVL